MSLAALRSAPIDPTVRTLPRAASEPDFAFGGAEYAALLAQCPADAFRDPAWLEAAYRHLVPARGGRPAILTLRDQHTGTLLGLLPLAIRPKNGLRLLECADFGVGDYAGPVLDPALERRLLADPAIALAVRAALPAHDVLRIRPVRPERVAAWEQLLDVPAEPLGFSAHEAPLEAPYGIWRAQKLRASVRRNLDRRRRRLERSGRLELRRLEDGAAAARSVAEIARLRAGRFVGDPIQEAPVRLFYEAVARAGAAGGACAVHTLELDGEALATLLTLDDRDGRRLYLLIGCDYARVGRFSPGLVAYDLLMEDHADRGGRVFDFTIGDEPFKRDYGTLAVPMSGIAHAPTLRGRVGLLAWRWREARRERLGAAAPCNQTPEEDA